MSNAVKKAETLSKMVDEYVFVIHEKGEYSTAIREPLTAEKNIIGVYCAGEKVW